MSNNIWPPAPPIDEDENDKAARLEAEREAKRIRYAHSTPQLSFKLNQRRCVVSDAMAVTRSTVRSTRNARSCEKGGHRPRSSS